MTDQELHSCQDTFARATKDIHERCGVEIDVLWDDGHSHTADSMHKVKVWNGLGSLDYWISHGELVERGAAYQRFLQDLSAAVRERLSLRP